MNEALPASAAVLIVGGGPTGLSLANVLTRYGVTVRIIERKARLSHHTKATNLMQRTQELISALGFLAPLERDQWSYATVDGSRLRQVLWSTNYALAGETVHGRAPVRSA